MSAKDKEKIATLLSLIEPHLSWRFVGIVVAVPTALIACVTMAGYLFATATFLQGINYAVNRVPKIDSQFHRTEVQLQTISAEVAEIKDTLIHEEDYRFTR